MSCSAVLVPSEDVGAGRGDARCDPGGLEAGLQVLEVRGEEALLSSPAVGLGEEAVETGERGRLVVEGEGERKAGGVGEAEGEEPLEDRMSGGVWVDKRRFFRPS